MARCAMRSRQFTGYTLGPLECIVRGRLFDSEGGEGGSQNFVWTDNLFSAWAWPEISFMWHGLGKIYFRVNMVNHSPLRQFLETVMLLKAVK